MTIILTKDIQAFFSDSLDVFEQIMGMKGVVYRAFANRETIKCHINGRPYFIKKHGGIGWREIFKNLFQGKWPVFTAKNEWKGIQHLQRIGINAPCVMGFGEKGWNPATRRSFIILESLENKISVNSLVLKWRETQINFKLKRILIGRIAEIISSMHLTGLNHRDCYLLHFLIDQDITEIDEHFPIHVIDLHRAQIRKKTPRRWMIKDVAGIYFSSMNIQLTRNDCFNFIKAYTGKPLRQALKDKNFWLKVEKQAKKLYKTRPIQ